MLPGLPLGSARHPTGFGGETAERDRPQLPVCWNEIVDMVRFSLFPVLPVCSEALPPAALTMFDNDETDFA